MYTIITRRSKIFYFYLIKDSLIKKIITTLYIKKTRKQYLSIHFRKIKIIKLYISNKKLNNTK